MLSGIPPAAVPDEMREQARLRDPVELQQLVYADCYRTESVEVKVCLGALAFSDCFRASYFSTSLYPGFCHGWLSSISGEIE